MSFFDVPAPQPPPRPEPPEQPEWAGPRPGVLPGYSSQRAVLFRTDEILLLAHRCLVYPTGVEFTLSLLLRDGGDLHDVPWELRRPPHRGDPPPNDFVRFGIMFSDGSKWTNLRPWHPGKEPAPPVVVGRGGGGGGGSWDMGYWIWPLPPEGSLTFAAEWPAHDLDEHRASVDADELRTKAGEAEIIWE